MSDYKPKINISTNVTKSITEIKKFFEDFDVTFSGGIYRKSFEDTAMQVVIFLTGAFVGGASWDLLKIGVKKLISKFPNSQITLRDKDAIMYTVKNEQEIVVIVVPSRSGEFSNIKTLDDLIDYLKSKYD